MTRFATEQVPAQLLREGKVLYDVTLDLIIAESEADELSTPVTRNIVRMDLAPGTVVENGYYDLRFNFDDKQMEDTVYVKGTALMHRVSSKPQSRLVQPAPAGVHYGRNLLAEAHGR